ncbi:MAG: nuclear transport factor 2 family protein [Candidatus Sericytochromatia bacterium]|nr:nuclear transport factor 2 family protein [Candidatus Sericytochromatia bacterium]
MSLKDDVTTLYNQIFSGQLLDAFDHFYAEDVVMQENNEAPTVGKAANREREVAFLGSVEAFHDGGISNLAWNDETGVAMIENWMDLTFQGGFRTKMQQVAVQTWKDGKVVNERFYYNKG